MEGVLPTVQKDEGLLPGFVVASKLMAYAELRELVE
jgi:hypothetical protein